ncbi:nitrate- and nitrite sensing domain-containing protein [Catellatospora sp. NPDC049133]|uniref:sensor histidine kinase n=1 Tax=Catellatospora sp. NPDC049133 TaxID=3155499 RepID=UPI0033C895B2
MLRLNNLAIRTKTALIVVPTAAAALITSGVALQGTVDAAVDAAQTRSLVEVAAAAGDLTHELQAERAGVAALLLPDAGQQVAAAYGQQVERTGQAAARFRARYAQLEDPPAAVAAILTRIDAGLADLDGQRARMGQSKPIALSSATFSYRILVADLVTYQETAAQAGVDPVLADEIRAAAALARAKESLGQQHVAVLQTLAIGTLTPSLAQDIAAARSGYDDALREFNDLGRPQWRTLLSRTLTGPEALDAARLEGVVTSTGAYQPLALPGGAAAWTAALSTRADRLRQVEIAAQTDITGSVQDAWQQQITKAATTGGLLLVALLIALLTAVVVARSTATRLRTLERAAQEIATTRLPAMVAQFRNVSAHDQPEQVEALAAEATARPAIILPGSDEVGEVVAAFNGLYRVVVVSTAGEASARARMAGTVVTLAMKVQTLVESIIHNLDSLERSADDELMAKLYPIDHQVTRLRRLATNLLVLGGAGLGRLHPADEPVESLVQAAGSMVDDYLRVTLRHSESAIVRSHGVSAVVHVLGELLHNATRYSSADSSVAVDIHWLGNDLVICITDNGMGMRADQLAHLNALLSQPKLDVDVPGQMGLVVVGRLAAEHRLNVRLQRAEAGSGTVALLTIPGNLVSRPAAALPAMHARLAGPAGGRPARPAAAAAPAALDEATAALPTIATPRQLTAAASDTPRSPWMDPAAAADGFVTPADQAWAAAAALRQQSTGPVTASGLPRRTADPSRVPTLAPPADSARAHVIDPAVMQAQVATAMRGLSAAARTAIHPTGDPR